MCKNPYKCPMSLIYFSCTVFSYNFLSILMMLTQCSYDVGPMLGGRQGLSKSFAWLCGLEWSLGQVALQGCFSVLLPMAVLCGS